MCSWSGIYSSKSSSKLLGGSTFGDEPSVVAFPSLWDLRRFSRPLTSCRCLAIRRLLDVNSRLHWSTACSMSVCGWALVARSSWVYATLEKLASIFCVVQFWWRRRMNHSLNFGEYGDVRMNNSICCLVLNTRDEWS